MTQCEALLIEESTERLQTLNIKQQQLIQKKKPITEEEEEEEETVRGRAGRSRATRLFI